MSQINDLIYDNSFMEKFLEQYPKAEIVDASDDIHESRFQITLPPEVSLSEYAQFLMESGASVASLLFQDCSERCNKW
jgi:hypothetical protein